MAQKRSRRWLVAGALIAAAVGIPLAFAGSQDCPSIAALRAYRPPEASHVYALDGSLLAELAPQRRTLVDFADIPALVRDGVVAVEDRRFWEHDGVDPRGVVRAVWRDLLSLSFKEGFSTIPMQLARNVFPKQLPRAKKIGRKICEIRLADDVEREFGKEGTLELYLNQIYLGDGFYGIEAASRGYFGKSVAAVTPAEAALLIGLVQSPEGYNPRKHPLRAIRRRNVVLNVMAREGVISSEVAERAKARPLRLAPPIEAAGPAPYVVAAVRADLRERFGPDADVRGLRVYTGIDPALQRAAREELVAQIERIEAGEYGPYRHPRPTADQPPVDSAAVPYLQGMFIALDPQTGAIRALVGGRDFSLSQFNRALQARRQPGSAFKPIVYAAAIERGLPLTARIETTPLAVDDPTAPVAWRPGDHLPDSVETLSVREALARSSNHAAVRVGRWAGVENVVSLAHTLGLTTPIPEYPSIFLGAAEVVPAELVAAYATFGNGGFRVQPHIITRVEDDQGHVLWQAPAAHERVLNEGVAFLTLSMLRDAVDYGTGTAVRGVGFHLPAAGKTGTTNGAKDTWFIGLTPDLVAGVWLGFDQPAPIVAGASGGLLAAPVWGRFMERAYRDRPLPRPWMPPPTLLTVAIDTETGMRATGNCPLDQVRTDFFLPGTEPLDTCPLHPEGSVERLFDRLWRGIKGIF
ncbi:MAG TPA: transglycosylase domain-containing protein [Longimicrobiales bacterium]